MAEPEVNVTAKPPVDCTGLTPKMFLLRDEALDICCFVTGMFNMHLLYLCLQTRLAPISAKITAHVDVSVVFSLKMME